MNPGAGAEESEAVRMSRLRWRCRRGMRELDVLLARYLDRVYPQATEAQRRTFEALLELQDPLILAYVVGTERPAEPSMADVIQQLTAAPPT